MTLLARPRRLRSCSCGALCDVRHLGRWMRALNSSVLCRDCAAVASSRAGELYGMQMLDQGIQDDQDNFTYAVMRSVRQLRH